MTRYLAVFAVLLLFTGVTILVAERDLGLFNTPIALGIAGVKAACVGLFFMHLRGARGLVVMVAVAGLLWLGILISLTAGEYLTRAHVLGW